MMAKPVKITLIRGLPGSGKSHAAAKLGVPIFEADQFVDYTLYNPDWSAAHLACQKAVYEKIVGGEDSIVVANTFIQRWEMEFYLSLNKGDLGPDIRVVVVDLYDGGCSDTKLASRNVHRVSCLRISQMRRRYQFSWWSAPILRESSLYQCRHCGGRPEMHNP